MFGVGVGAPIPSVRAQLPPGRPDGDGGVVRGLRAARARASGSGSSHLSSHFKGN